MRIRGYDEETEEYIGGVEELSGKIADLTKTTDNPGGITLFTDDEKTEYKSTYQLLKDISEIYDQLTDKQQAELLEALAGKRSGQIVAATLNNFGAAEEAIKTMENSAGSANREMSVIEESIDYKLNKLKQTWVGLAQEVIDNGSLGTIIDMLTQVSEILSTIIGFDIGGMPIGAFGTLAAGVGGYQALKNKDGIMSAFANIKENAAANQDVIDSLAGKNIEEIREVLAELDESTAKSIVKFNKLGDGIKFTTKSIDGLTERYTPLISQIEHFTDVEKKQLIASISYTNGSKEQVGQIVAQMIAQKGLTAEEEKDIMAKLGLSGATDGATVSMGAYASALYDAAAAEIAALASNPITWIAGIAAACVGAIAGLKAIANGLDEVDKSASKYAETVNEKLNEISENGKTLESLKETYSELSSGVDGLGNNVSLTDEEYSKFLDTSKKIADICPSLIAGYNDQNDVILTLKNNVDLLDDAYRQASQDAYDLIINGGDSTNGENFETVYKSLRNNYENHGWSKFVNTLFDYGTLDGQNVLFRTNDYQQKELEGYLSLLKSGDIDLFNSQVTYKIQDDFMFGLRKMLGDNSVDLLSGIASQDLNDPVVLKSAIDTLEAEIAKHQNKTDAKVGYMKTMSRAFLGVNDTYKNSDDAEFKNIASIIASNISAEKSFEISSSDNPEIEFRKYISSIVDSLTADNGEIKKDIVSIFEINAEDMPVDETISAFEEYFSDIEEFLTSIGIDKDMFLKIFGLDNIDLSYDLKDRAIKKIQDKYGVTSDDAAAIAGKFTTDELNSIVNTTNEDMPEVTVPINGNAVDSITLSMANLVHNTDMAKQAAADYLGIVDDIVGRKVTIDTSGLDNYFSTLDNGEEVKDTLLDLVKAGKIDDDVLQSWGIYDDLLEAAGGDANELLKQLQEMANRDGGSIGAANDMNSIESAFGNLSTVYDAYYNDMSVSGKDITSLFSDFGDLSFFEDFVQMLEDSSKGVDGLIGSLEDGNDAFDKMASQYIDSKIHLDDLNESNKDYYIQQLQNNGIENAEEAVMARLNYMTEVYANSLEILRQVKGDLKYTTEDLQNATASEVAQFILDAQAAGADTSALKQLLLAKINAEHTINTGQNIDALVKEAEAAAIDATQLAMLKNADKMGDEGARQSLISEVRKSIERSLQPYNISLPNYHYGGSTNKNTGSGSGGGKDKTKEDKFEQIIDWIERRVQHFTTYFERWLGQAEKTLRFADKYYSRAAKQSEGLATTYGQAYTYYMKKADKVGLSSKYAKKVRNGEIQIEKIKDEKLYNKIQKYQEYYDKAQQSLDNYISEVEKLYNLPLDKAAKNIEKINTKIELINARIDNTSVDDYKKANKRIDDRLAKQKEILDQNQKAANETLTRYKGTKKGLKSVNKLGDGVAKDAYKSQISSAIKNNKEVDLGWFKEGSKAYKWAVKYNTALQKRRKAVDDLKLATENYLSELKQSKADKFSNITGYFDAKIARVQAKEDLRSAKISKLQARGQKVTANYYKAQINAETRKQEIYEIEKKKLVALRNEMKKAGLVGTDVWYNVTAQIEDLDKSIQQSAIDIANFNKEIVALANTNFQKAIDKINEFATDIDWLVSLVGMYDNFQKDSILFTDQGFAKLGASVNGYYESLTASENYKKLVEDLEKHASNGELSFVDVFDNRRTYNSIDEMREEINGFYDSWQSQITTTYNYQSQIVDMMKEKLQNELSVLQNIIDAKKESLNAEKDLYEYQKTIREKTDNINSLQNQLAALSGDKSRENLMKLQRLQKELVDAQEDLQETEYDRYISDQQNMLDKLYEEYSDLIDSELRDIKILLDKGISIYDNNSSSIQKILSDIALYYNYTGNREINHGNADIESNIKNIDKGFATGGIGKYVKSKGEDFLGIGMFRNGEAILSPEDAKVFQNQLVPNMTKLIDASDKLSGLSKTLFTQSPANVQAQYSFVLENCTNASDIIKEIQRNQNVQKALQDVTINRLVNGGNLSVYKYK